MSFDLQRTKRHSSALSSSESSIPGLAQRRSGGSGGLLNIQGAATIGREQVDLDELENASGRPAYLTSTSTYLDFLRTYFVHIGQDPGHHGADTVLSNIQDHLNSPAQPDIDNAMMLKDDIVKRVDDKLASHLDKEMKASTSQGTEADVEPLSGEAFVLKSLSDAAPNHLQN
ncbi:hypothetical protein Pmar_PMAR014883 [Perkinsus marinus ATCC 50983]|uniref:Uncharacterized protein n=1 Tax=Perkinsus marinus (strain ATCC 50983 / TXsc) TaxID=423536 RepID=C5L560_PERM5|nr:hypothetical protein Pmar_PMAR014883 [Perkinsus marinus ATCC 50983]EER08119.1 hypothetical protein Pmar_PMAR014883 [Perkinsus marinus ATCC 50983]|eukprot:XP_002776303.1 hypothetical protein Pmar_PMAR014883 [Perkinsus marinus ATCC 50983]